MNNKREWRLWRKEGLNVPRRTRKKRLVGPSGNSCVRKPADYQGTVWAWEFLYDRTSNGRSLKWFTLLDEYTRECLALEVDRTIPAAVVQEVLAAAVRDRGAPRHVRGDNRPEFVAKSIRDWLAASGLKTLYVAPGAPWENGYAESFHCKVRDELLNLEVFGTVVEARVLAKDWRQHYNCDRPHSSLGYRNPTEFAATAHRAGRAPEIKDGEIRCDD